MSEFCCGSEPAKTPKKNQRYSTGTATLPRDANTHRSGDDCALADGASGAPQAVAINEQGQAVDACGCPIDNDVVLPGEPTVWWKDWAIIIPLLAGLCLLGGWLLSPWCYWVGLVLGASQFVPESLKRLFTGPKRLTIGLLMTISAVGAIAVGRVDSAAALAFLFSLAEALEHAAMARAKAGLTSLMTLIPTTAHRVKQADPNTSTAATTAGNTVATTNNTATTTTTNLVDDCCADKHTSSTDDCAHNHHAEPVAEDCCGTTPATHDDCCADDSVDDSCSGHGHDGDDCHESHNVHVDDCCDAALAAHHSSRELPIQSVGESAAASDDCCGGHSGSGAVAPAQSLAPAEVSHAETSVNHNEWQDIAVPTIAVGDWLRILPGERVPTDGDVVVGQGSIDTSAVTGESMPVAVAPGDSIPAGAIVNGQALTMVATTPGHDNTLTKIVGLVTAAQQEKGERARMADAVAAPLIPIVLIVALAVGVVGSLLGDPAIWIERALVVLVAASPCALAIAVPVTVIAAIGAASRHGVVVTSGAAFERLGAIETVAFDKTGTLTTGTPTVVAVEGDDNTLALAAALEATSTHPLATAIMNAAKNQTGTTTSGSVAALADELTDIAETPGTGMQGVWRGQAVALTKPSAAKLTGSGFEDVVSHHEEQGCTVVVLSVNEKVHGVIAVADPLREDTAATIKTLNDAKINTMMLTGDNRRAAYAIGRRAGIDPDNIHAELLPADKANIAKRYDHLAMIGDGINDAPALAAADVGIAMGDGATDAAVDSADIALTGHNLNTLVTAITHAARGRKIMTANIALAVAVIAILPPLAMFGVLGLGAVVFIHEAAEVVIIANGLRAAKLKKEKAGA